MLEILISHHRQDLEPYLDIAITSVLAQTLKPKLTVLSSGDISKEMLDKFPFIIVDKSLTNATKKVNHFLDNLEPSTKYTMIMSNDVCLSSNTCEQLTNTAEQLDDSILCPISNNEIGARYLSSSPYCLHEYSISDLNPIEIMNFRPTHGLLFRVPWVSFYCPFISVKTWNKIGRLDEELNLSHNDVDFCLRAAKNYIPTFIHGNAFALHYGSKSNVHDLSNPIKDKAMDHFLKKWSPNEIISLII